MLQIKDLKDLSVSFGRGCYRHAGPKGPEEVPFTVGRGTGPRHASVGKMRWLACVFRSGRTIAGDRPPRYGPLLPCAVRNQASPNYIQSLGHANARGGLSPAPEGWVLCGKRNSTSKENSNVIHWFMSEYFMGYLLKCDWFFMLGSPIS